MSADVFGKLMAYLAKWFEKLMKMFEQIKAWSEEVSSRFAKD